MGGPSLKSGRGREWNSLLLPEDSILGSRIGDSILGLGVEEEVHHISFSHDVVFPL